MQQESLDSGDLACPLGQEELLADWLEGLSKRLRASRSPSWRWLWRPISWLAGRIEFILYVGVGIIAVASALLWGPDVMAAITAAIAYVVAVNWAVIEQARARSRKAVYGLLRDFARNPAAQSKEREMMRCTTTLRTSFWWIADPKPTKTATSFAWRVASTFDRAPELGTISDHYFGNEERARDYLCVICANHTTQFLKPGTLSLQVAYFGSFRRSEMPRNRLTRVFSVPVAFTNEDHPSTSWETSGFSREMRQQLFAILWLNDTVGVDTKLHVFDPSHQECQDFFQAADYVICHDLTCDDPEERYTIFLLKPDEERRTSKLTGHDLYSVFQCEFYQRVSGHWNPTEEAKTRELISEVCVRKAGPVMDLLGLTLKECSDVIGEVISGESPGK